MKEIEISDWELDNRNLLAHDFMKFKNWSPVQRILFCQDPLKNHQYILFVSNKFNELAEAQYAGIN